ncbi:NUDIX domain-containing protein [Mobilitalea sibirica]|uniref:NUDIX domain-containing protein n=1 Tax=Mobilitalea sibirica TaxID=1462919 RepID=A0A8J7H8U8_9FIRM|nr:NUDIX domain-containing protein [Mobilitalea sibirica]MBH1940550.1 NUDIX domain-containing protein [Mobilitalea sibirica]
MEIWDIYDDCFMKTGRTHERGKPLAKGDYHLVVHIYPINKKGEILIQKRAETISWKPGIWAATGGSAIAGEDAWTACQRELLEELGIKATKENSTLAFMYKRLDHFSTVWLVKTDIEIKDLKLQKSEVADAKWVTQKQLRKMIADGVFFEYSYLDFLFKLIKLEK